MKPKATLIISAAIIALLPVVVVNSCISEFEAGIDTDENAVLVVSGDIIENTEVDFTLSKTFGVDYPAPPGESKEIIATVTMIGSDGSQSAPATSMGQGVYRLAIGELNNDVGNYSYMTHMFLFL